MNRCAEPAIPTAAHKRRLADDPIGLVSWPCARSGPPGARGSVCVQLHGSQFSRRCPIQSAARVVSCPVTRQVIKLGSSSIASGDGLALDVIAGLVAQIATAQRAGHEIILVTSGAARLGRRLLAFEGPTEPMPQATEMALPASVCQPALMALYRQLAPAVGHEVCQIPVSRTDLASARAMVDLSHLLRDALARH